jgi:hypothetical protein
MLTSLILYEASLEAKNDRLTSCMQQANNPKMTSSYNLYMHQASKVEIIFKLYTEWLVLECVDAVVSTEYWNTFCLIVTLTHAVSLDAESIVEPGSGVDAESIAEPGSGEMLLPTILARGHATPS